MPNTAAKASHPTPMNVTVICRECGDLRKIPGFLSDSDVICYNACRAQIGTWADLKELAQPAKANDNPNS
jgi:hypothetical protein